MRALLQSTVSKAHPLKENTMTDVAAQDTYKGYHISIVYCTDSAQNPRTEYDNVGTMYCLHNRYTLGDEHEYSNPTEILNAMIQSADPAAPDTDEMRPDHLPEDFPLVWLPLYLYDHSGITMSTAPFSCPWDSGQVGYIFVTYKDAQKEYGLDPSSEDFVEQVKKRLRNEVNTYDCYLRGDVYGYEVSQKLDDDEDEEVDSCYGFYGEEYCMEAAKECVDGLETQ
jgi:hypothetical protein